MTKTRKGRRRIARLRKHVLINPTDGNAHILFARLGGRLDRAVGASRPKRRKALSWRSKRSLESVTHF
jgi:hypothetical protein